jgi:hypothetical protein
MMDDQKILDSAPEGSLIVDSKFRFFDGRYSELDKVGNWTWKKTMPAFPIRSLADIKDLVKLREANAELEKGYEELRMAALHAVCKIGGGQAKADLRDAYDKATEQLEALKEKG